MLSLLCNGFLLFIPVFIWNIVLSRKLPDFYKNKTWDSIPKSLLLIENVFRYLSFFIPILMFYDFTSIYIKFSFVIYFFSIIIYFISWLLQIKIKNIKYNNSLLIRGAPAYTTIIWLAAIGLICNKTYIPELHIRFIYFVVISFFTITHTIHVYLVVKKIKY